MACSVVPAISGSKGMVLCPLTCTEKINENIMNARRDDPLQNMVANLTKKGIGSALILRVLRIPGHF